MDLGGYKVAKYRTLSEKNKYYIPKEDYLTAIHYSLRYPLWVAEMDTNADTRGAIRYDKDKIQSSNDYDSTEAVGIKRAELSEKIKLVEEMIEIACDGSNLEKWLKLGVCFGLTFNQLKMREMPCERDMYYQIRQRYFYELAQRI